MKGYLAVKNKRQVSRVSVEEIMYILRDGRRLIVTTEEKEYVYYEKIDAIQGLLSESFYRPLDRCIVNMDYLKSVDVIKRRMIFRNGDELFLGRDACSKTKAAFYTYLLKGNEEFGEFSAAESEGKYR